MLREDSPVAAGSESGAGVDAPARQEASSGQHEPPRRPAVPVRSKAERVGRRAGIAVFTVLVVSFTGILASQILRQVFSPAQVTTQVGCERGLQGLLVAVRRARTAAANQSSGEREALERFRSALEPEWLSRPALGQRCGGSSANRQALVEIDRLRYAEEHAVRYEAMDLAKRRLHVRDLEARLLRATPPTPSGLRPPE